MKYLAFIVFLSGSLLFSKKELKLKNKVHQEQRKTSLLSGKLELNIPTDLQQLTDDELISQYPNLKQRPTAVFENKATKIKLSINYGSSPAKDKNLPEIKTFFEKMYSNYGGIPITGDFRVVNKKKVIILQFELPNQQKNGKVFNYFLVATISGKLLLVDYSFPSEQRSNQEPMGSIILNSAIFHEN